MRYGWTLGWVGGRVWGVKECVNAGMQDLSGESASSLRRETPEVRLVGDVREACDGLGPVAKAMLDALPKFAPETAQEGMFQ